jgi:hypothetical protein
MAEFLYLERQDKHLPVDKLWVGEF